MPDNKIQLEEFLQFIKERRSDESHFEEIYKELQGILSANGDNQQKGENDIGSLIDAKEKQAEEYRKAKEVSGTAWPEFEKFVTQLERGIMEALKE